MLFIPLETDKCRYVINASSIKEIIPLVNCVKASSGPDYIDGVINFRGKPVPVIDLGILMEGKACKKKMNTRIILVPVSHDDLPFRFVGFIAENITDTLRLDCSPANLSEKLINEFLKDEEREEGKNFVQLLDIKKILDKEKLQALRTYL